jgi:hypothetical protein
VALGEPDISGRKDHGSGGFAFSDTNAPVVPMRFYRAVSPYPTRLAGII